MSRKTWLLIIIAGLARVRAALCLRRGVAVLAYRCSRREHGRSRPAAQTPTRRRPPARLGASGGTLRLAGGLPPTLDPAMVQDSTSAEYVVHLFSGLVTLNAELEVVPDLAERWEISADGRTYTFYLRPEAAFADGKPITAAMSSIRSSAPAAQSWVRRWRQLSGRYRRRRGSMRAARRRAHRGLKAVDDHTLQITIDAPKALFPGQADLPDRLCGRSRADRAQERRLVAQAQRQRALCAGEHQPRQHRAGAQRALLWRKPAGLARVEFTSTAGCRSRCTRTSELDIVECGARRDRARAGSRQPAARRVPVPA